MADEHMTPAERGHRMLRDGGYVRHRDGEDIHHADAAQDRKLIHEEMGKARITPGRNKGGKIKGHRAAENPGRQRRASGGHITEEQHQPGDNEQNSRLARGGHKSGARKGGIGKVNIVIAHPDRPPMASPVAAPPPAIAPPRPPMPPPAAMPPGAGAMPPRPMVPPGGGAMAAPMAPRPGMPGGAMPMARPQGIRSGGPIRHPDGRFAGGSVR